MGRETRRRIWELGMTDIGGIAGLLVFFGFLIWMVVAVALGTLFGGLIFWIAVRVVERERLGFGAAASTAFRASVLSNGLGWLVGLLLVGVTGEVAAIVLAVSLAPGVWIAVIESRHAYGYRRSALIVLAMLAIGVPAAALIAGISVLVLDI